MTKEFQQLGGGTEDPSPPGTATLAGQYTGGGGYFFTQIANLFAAHGIANPMTAVGDLIVGGTAGAMTRLGVDADGKYLTPSSGVLGWADLPAPPSGKLRDVQIAVVTAAQSISATIPQDDTPPQITEGSQVITKALTAKDAANGIMGFCLAPISSSNNNLPCTVAAFIDSTADAIAWNGASAGGGGNRFGLAGIGFSHVPGDTSAHTYRIRMGPVANTIFVNADTNGTRIGGGTIAGTILILLEYEP